MFSEVALPVWSSLAVIWWVISWRLIAGGRLNQVARGTPSNVAEMSVFKPLPPLGQKGIGNVEDGLESFIAQLDPQTELLLGIHEADRAATFDFVQRMRIQYPAARLHVIFRSSQDEVMNPKIAWQLVLAPQASGELWLWSDADILAPPGFLQAARAEYANCGATMMTFPYIVRQIPSPPGLLDALFINVDFYPGVLLLRKLGAVDFGLGAAILFRRDDFLSKIDWAELGSMLADDFFLGQKLHPVRIGGITLETAAYARTWRDALGHDLRWAKTIRWNRWGGFAARIVVLPLAGWLAFVAMHPLGLFGWLGLVTMMQIDVVFAVAINLRLGCKVKVRDLLAIEAWTIWRILLWVLCWLPWPVVWCGRIWRGPSTGAPIRPDSATAVDSGGRSTELTKYQTETADAFVRYDATE